jgi:branched-subunit amino acid aminotransferase/4-amino-4-deoxychorismate lyase
LETADEQITAAAEELVTHNARLLPLGGELQLVTFATPGPLGNYVGDSANGPPTLGLVTYALPFARYRPFFAEGVTLAVTGKHPTDSTLLPPTVKHRSRMAWHIADYRARERTGNRAALGVPLCARSGSLTETSIGHFLIVIDGTVTTPPREMFLDGISLRVTEELCRAASIPFAEAQLPPSQRLQGAEAMLTGTAFCLAGVKELRTDIGNSIRFAWPGPVFRRLIAAWSDLVGMDVEGQFTGT